MATGVEREGRAVLKMGLTTNDLNAYNFFMTRMLRKLQLGMLALLPLVTGCGGFLSSGTTPTLDIPYIAQEQFNYCVPASIAMWRAYDGLAPLSQDYIWNALDGAPCSGDDAVSGVQRFTRSGADAYVDFESPAFRDEFFARQMASIDQRVPVMVVVGFARDHVGLINGGTYQYQSSTGRYTWHSVLLHDPGVGPNIEYSSNEWIVATCEEFSGGCAQIISSSASAGWLSALQAYGSSVQLYDGAGCCNQEHQY